MYLNLTGINHNTAPITIRERAAIRADRLREVLNSLISYSGYGIILSTCNRTEVYTVESGNPRDDVAGLEFLRDYLDVTEAELMDCAYRYTDREAAQHLFRVTSGLDSMIVGEFEVLGQVKQALDAAERAGSVNLPLRRIFQDAIRTGRQVREETGVSQNALSVSSVAVELASGVVGDLSKCTMLVIGAGEAGKLVAKAAKERGTQYIKVASRTVERATDLAAALNGTAIDSGDIVSEIASSDLIVTCADAPHYVLNLSQAREALQNRNGWPLVVIDIAVPRNVEPGVGELDNVFLYNIDDLNQISEQNRRQREREMKKAEEIIDAEVDKFISWWRTFSIRPVISALMNKAHRIRKSHLQKTMKKLPPLSEEERYSLDKMTEAIITKLLKDPIDSLKENPDENGEYARVVRELFRLDDEENK